ncbi:hypothetical protein A9B99_04295 [Mangrovibacter phragmitis]|uniref:Uncharacterized protein n=1 Tax=Mangrovibacter phragmitis TaxID=1691903 RepID=A0A1B7L9B9_9ENTR|nr:hypothetical protein A9B99_04295 [Mangrovibacter phragmitis]
MGIEKAETQGHNAGILKHYSYEVWLRAGWQYGRILGTLRGLVVHQNGADPGYMTYANTSGVLNG